MESMVTSGRTKWVMMSFNDWNLVHLLHIRNVWCYSSLLFISFGYILECCLYKDWLFGILCVWELMYLYTLHFTCYNGSLPFCANGTMYQPSVNWADDPGDSWIRIIVAAWLRCTTHMKSFKGTLGRRFDRCLMILGSSRSLNCLVLSNWMNWIHLSNFHKWELRVPCVPPLAKFPACSY